MRVLVADDDSLNRDILKRMFLKLGIECVLAASGDEAVAAVAAAGAEGYGLVFCDLSMPVLDGYETARALRAGGTKAVLIALTGSDESASIYEAGFDGFLQKPVTIDHVRQVLARYGGLAAPASPAPTPKP